MRDRMGLFTSSGSQGPDPQDLEAGALLAPSGHHWSSKPGAQRKRRRSSACQRPSRSPAAAAAAFPRWLPARDGVGIRSGGNEARDDGGIRRGGGEARDGAGGHLWRSLRRFSARALRAHLHRRLIPLLATAASGKAVDFHPKTLVWREMKLANVGS
ncbi:hypothetical protein E2562_005061 [Oryza meyeriana var. granulata]|uniref:Uncharacterized protein n=1 Tax=Oryza meyeriana var. granulata TaxID=110450 RepID=A0A6G1BTC0_9ORYZ|nr:hypothetical protein E2562_005061 [Oryza meyeriana var. granulata]